MLAAAFIFIEILQEEEEEAVKEKEEEEDVLSLPNLTVNTTPWW
jgi:hypothetical protein